MKISIIVPSYNQFEYIETTFLNLKELKEELRTLNVYLEILLFDNCSNKNVIDIINKYEYLFDLLKIEKDNGQYDAINKGILQVSGQYWTWLNTDDILDINGIKSIIKILLQDNEIDYIYGNTRIINENNIEIKTYKINQINYSTLTKKTTSITQPGSFFRTEFTKNIGSLKPYDCCFDYEYVIRLFKNNCKSYHIDQVTAHFRYYSSSKSGAKEIQFLKEKIDILRNYTEQRFTLLILKLYKRIILIHLKNTIMKLNQRFQL